MLDAKSKGLLLNIIKHCIRIESKIEGITKEAYDANEDIKEIICFNLIQIGELTTGFTPEFIALYNKVPWNRIKGMRNRIAHGYGTIDPSRVWFTAITDIKPLRMYCEEILKMDSND